MLNGVRRAIIMRMETSVFGQLSPDFAKLIAYGFLQQGETFVLRAPILGGEFTVTVEVSKDGSVRTSTVDEASGEPYTLHLVDEAQGVFVGSVRAAFDALLADIAAHCFVRDVFPSPQAHRLIDHVRATHVRELEFLWEKFPADAVWRRADNGKWFGLLARLPAAKIGRPDGGLLDVLNVRADASEIAAILDGTRYFPAYHMNKRHWLTLPLDDTLPDEEIFSRIDASFALAKLSGNKPV